MKVSIYKPRYWTRDLHESKKRWHVCVCHRRSGKTVASLNHLVRDAIMKPNTRYAYIAPTYKQAKNISWEILKEYTEQIDGAKRNESELYIQFANGSRITLYGADNPDALRGMALWGVVYDEYSQQPSNIHSEIIRPALADHKGYAIWIGTPKGKNAFYRQYRYACSGVGEDDEVNPNWNNKEWNPIFLTVEDTGLIDEKELEDSKQSMDSDEYRQEWYCSFEASTKGAYYGKEIEKMRTDKRLTRVPYDESLPVNTFWDLGVSDSTAIGFFQSSGGEHRMIDFYEASGEGLKHYIDILAKKPYTYFRHTAPHDIKVRELGSGKSRLEVAAELGLRFDIAPKLELADGINACRMKLGQLWVDEVKCAKWVDAISQYQKEWDNRAGEFKKKPLHNWTSHAADMTRYWAITPDITYQDFDIGVPKTDW